VSAGEFTLEASDGEARAGRLTTAHGDVETPVFMPVGTRATVKAVDPRELEQLGGSSPILVVSRYFLWPRHARSTPTA
jgi:queuine tRNA-ribosyltransferase